MPISKAHRRWHHFGPRRILKREPARLFVYFYVDGEAELVRQEASTFLLLLLYQINITFQIDFNAVSIN